METETETKEMFNLHIPEGWYTTKQIATLTGERISTVRLAVKNYPAFTSEGGYTTVGIPGTDYEVTYYSAQAIEQWINSRRTVKASGIQRVKRNGVKMVCWVPADRIEELTTLLQEQGITLERAYKKQVGEEVDPNNSDVVEISRAEIFNTEEQTVIA